MLVNNKDVLDNMKISGVNETKYSKYDVQKLQVLQDIV